MKKLIWALVLAVPMAQLMAQPTDKNKKQEVQIEIGENRVIIEAKDLEGLSEVDLNGILREVSKRTKSIMQQQQELLAQVDEQLANEQISEEQAEELREEIHERTEESMELVGEMMEVWGEQFEARMETWAEAYEAKMEAWEEEMETRAESGDFNMPPLPALPPVPAPGPPSADNDSVREDARIIIDDKGITIRKGKDGDKPFALKFEEQHEAEGDTVPKKRYSDHTKIDRSETYFDIHLGFNQMLKDGESFIMGGSEELKFWKSTAFDLGIGGKTRIGSPYSKMYIKWGGEFSWHNFRLIGDNTLQRSEGGVVIGEDSIRSISMSKYNIAYFNVPLMLQLDFSEPGEMDESFTVGVGGYGGVRLRGKRQLEYSNDVFDEAEEQLKNDFFTNQFRYGVMAQVGWDSFKITGKYDLNPFFQKDKGPDYQMAQVTFGFTL